MTIENAAGILKNCSLILRLNFPFQFASKKYFLIIRAVQDVAID